MTKKNSVSTQENPTYHVRPRPGGGWQVKQEGTRKTIKAFLTQKEAIQFARGLAHEVGGRVDIHHRKKVPGKLPKNNAEFWLGASQTSLDAVWDNDEDDVYAKLLET
ncbi:DUF2188 domain-containing protein [Synechococcus sp. PCC 6312]|uniref:DUF2188 domain-containing protein n=1 Tax=Synechococcus sp. (strain ATCC 27167 / PCC 6312) TaxID=195253 RepID=UPI00029F2CC6|nr:DUF2188 domain-containing protein [Synechococcus sp. PCC 6312]AFY61695.1 hypothetical protein Syn6312_2597 [Synechococcus sp. PCC 6312]